MATTATDRPDAAPAPSPNPGDRRPRWHGWLTFLLPLILLAVLVGADRLGGAADVLVDDPLTDFALPDTDGGTYRLSESLARGDTLLYFSMGVGCYGCFAQIPEISGALAGRGIELVSIMVDPPDLVRATAERFDLEDPIVIDADRAVSEAYGMLGVYGHPDRPGHSFVLLRGDGTIAGVEHYADMYVPLDRLLADLELT